MRFQHPCSLRRTLFLLGALIAAAAVHGHASAQQPPDVVELEDGSMYRGTISELVSNDHVSIVTATGDTRTFQMSDVKFAGPAFRWESQQTQDDVSAETPTDADDEAEPATDAVSDGSSPTPPQAPPSPRPAMSTDWSDAGAMVSFRASSDDEDERVTFYRRHRVAVGSDGDAHEYIPICTTPCSATIPRDALTFGIAPPESTNVREDDSIDVRDGMLIEGQYGSSTFARVMAGLLIGLGVAGVGTAVVAAVLQGNAAQSQVALTLATAGGVVVGAGGLIGGIALAVSLDGTYVEVVGAD